MLWFTGKDTELKEKVLVNISHYSKPSKIVFTLSKKLLRQDYIIRLDSYYGSPEIFGMLNSLETGAVGTVRSNRKGLPRDIMGKKLKKRDLVFSFRRKLMSLKLKYKRSVFMLGSLHDEGMQTVHYKRCGRKTVMQCAVLTFMISTL
jgi:hypothetical protein